jgi:PAS domain S-box-containing protein
VKRNLNHCRELRIDSKVNNSDEYLSALMARISALGTLIAAGVGVLVLIGWVIGSAHLTSFVPDCEASRPKTAFSLVLAGMALWLLRNRPAGVRRKVAQVSALLPGLIAGFVLSEQLLGFRFGFEESVFQMVLGRPAAPALLSMSLIAVIAFIIMAICLLLLDVRTRNNHSPAQWLSLAPLMLSLLALIGYSYGAEILYRAGQPIAMALPSAIGVLALSVGVIFARPDRLPMALLGASNLGGFLARRLLPAALAFPILVGTLRMLGQRAGFFGTELGLALFTVANLLFFSVLIGWAAWKLAGIDEQRLKSEADLRESERHFHQAFANAPIGMALTDLEGRLLHINRAYCEITGYEEGELLRPDMDFKRLTHPADLGRNLEEFNRLLAGDIPAFFVEKHYIRKDHSLVPVRVSASLRRDSEGRPFQIIGLIENITGRKRMEEELRQAHALIEGITTGTEDLIAAEDHEFRFLYFNDAYRRAFKMLWGRDPEMGMSMVEVLAPWPEEQCKARELWSRALKGESFTVMMEFGPSEGNKRTYDLRFNPVHDAQGQSIGAAHILRDVTEQVQMQQALRVSERRLGLALDAAQAAAWEVNLATGEHIWDERFMGLFRVPKELFADVQQRWIELVLAEDRERAAAEFAEASGDGGAQYNSEFRARRMDGVVRWYHSRGIVENKPGNGVRRMLGVLQDITEQKVVQEKLANANENLERTVRERTAKLHETVHELEAFSYSLSHDMRAPLRAMKSFAQILEAEHGSQLGPEGNLYLSKISMAAGRLDQLIQDVLSYSRILRGEIKLQHVDLEKLAHQLIEENPALQPPHAEIKIESPLHPVLGHEAYLMQVLSNLVYNAVKFVAPGEKSRVRIWTEPVDSEIRLFVEDNGIGIPKEAQERMFGMFERFHDQRIYEGTGIGLTIVRKAVERLGGRVGVESEPCKGSIFWIQLRNPEESNMGQRAAKGASER